MPNFLAAAQRHMDDGDFLHQDSRIPNAVQLWAYGAECTLKAIALKQNLFQLDADNKPQKPFAIHLNQTAAGGSTLLSLYNAAQSGTAALLGPSTAFVGWDINARYEDGSHLQTVTAYLADANRFRQMLMTARATGLLL